MASKLSREELARFIDEDFPQAKGPVVEAFDDQLVRLRLVFEDRYLRPGGTISGPTLFFLADMAAYFIVLAAHGPIALAVTSSMTMNFLRKPAPRDLIAEARPLKLGRRLVVTDVRLFSDGDPASVAQATLTYAVPALGSAP
jgi:uncharacterized protein (TIGR00369 family)